MTYLDSRVIVLFRIELKTPSASALRHGQAHDPALLVFRFRIGNEGFLAFGFFFPV